MVKQEKIFRTKNINEQKKKGKNITKKIRTGKVNEKDQLEFWNLTLKMGHTLEAYQ